MTATVVTELRATEIYRRCQASSCSDSGCSLSLVGAPEPYALLNLENETAPTVARQQHCDYLFVGGADANGGPWVAPVELTTGKKRASEFLAQLAGGASVADGLLRRGIPFRFNPIAVHDGGLDSREIKNLRKSANRLRFRGKSKSVQLARCGAPLATALKA